MALVSVSGNVRVHLPTPTPTLMFDRLVGQTGWDAALAQLPGVRYVQAAPTARAERRGV